MIDICLEHAYARNRISEVLKFSGCGISLRLSSFPSKHVLFKKFFGPMKLNRELHWPFLKDRQDFLWTCK